ncbi:MAG: ATP-binding protein [Amaricoccus sp.]|uniref:ATP-binding protein n=1 Tax=Amaricoccus sp. TaxID=1872485 RepID=UPI0039E376EE
MDGSDVARRHTRRTASIAIAAVLVGVGLLGKVYDDQGREAWRQQSRARVGEGLNLIASDLQGRIEADAQLVRGLIAVVSADPGIDPDRFHRIGAELLNGQPESRMVTAAPDRIVSMVYPEDGDLVRIGYEFRPETLPAEILEPGSHSIALVGPIEAHFGGQVFSVRAAVFVGPSQLFWGIVSLVIDAPALFRVAGVDNPMLPFDVAVESRNSDGAEAVFGNPSVHLSDPVQAEVKVPGGTWVLAAVPRGGWSEPPSLWVTRTVFVMLAAALVGAILAATRIAEARQRQVAIIHEREAELSRLSWRLEFALASSNVGVWDVDLATDELFWDARAKALFGHGHDAGPFFGFKDWEAVVHPDDRARATAEADRAVKESGLFASRYRIVLPSGEVRHIRDMARVHADADGRRRLVGLIWDVTEEVERQEELELKRVEAEAATTAKSRFLASMSHEIRTPMSGVLGVLGLMLDDPLPPQQRERARIALASAEALLEILNDILDFSKLEAAQVVLGREPVDIRGLVGEVMELMSPNATRKGLAISHAVSAAVPRFVLADPLRLRQILTNFLSNATKFTNQGEIMVRVDYMGAASGELVIEVEDTGIGVSPEHQAAIFQRFIQADDSLARRAGGTGLGLSISSQLAELMGGRVTLRSVVGMGSTFRVEIPCRAVAAEDVGREERSDSARPAPMRVLLAEDHATNQYVIGAYLRDAGHTVTLVETGADAVRAVRDGDFDVVLMDVQMPVMDGLAAAAAIRALDGPAAAVPILALTASAMPGDREACLAAGMNGHLTKPINAANLRAALREVAASPPLDDEDGPAPSLRTGTS